MNEQYNVPHKIRPAAKDVLIVGSGGGVDIERLYQQELSVSTLWKSTRPSYEWGTNLMRRNPKILV